MQQENPPQSRLRKVMDLNQSWKGKICRDSTFFAYAFK